MIKTTKQKLLSCLVATAFVLSSTLTPFVANAATSNASGSVTRIGGVDRFETAALMAQKGWKGTSDSVVLSAGMTNNLVDALAAGPLAYKLNAPILLTDGGLTLNAFAKAELQRLKPKKAYITSGTGVIKPSVIAELKAMGITPVALGGLDRYETSVKIAKELALQGVDITRVVFAAAWATPADALSVSSIAAAQGMPILATSKDQLPASVKAYLDTIKDNVTDSYVIGGTGVITDAVKEGLPGKASRHSGLDRYDTNVQVLKNFAKEYKNDKVYVANGVSLVDAVAGVPLAARDQSAVVLVTQQIASATKEFVKLNMSTDDMVVLGGVGAVSAAGMNALTSVASYATDGATVGSADATKPLVLKDNVRITGDNVTLKNAKAEYSVYVKGNNITLSNLTVKGTVFVDPGKTGSATIDGVTAGNIVILSGAPHSVIITNSSSGQITISSDGNTRIELASVTTNGVSVQTYIVYEKDATGNDVKTGTIAIHGGAGNDLGQMTITSDPGQTTEVKLSGEFKQPITVVGQGATTITAAAGAVISNIISNTNSLTLAGAGTYSSVVAQRGTLTAAPGTFLPSVTVATMSAGQTVTLAGQMGKVTQTQGNITLVAGTTVTSMTTTSSCTITVPVGSSIGTLVSTGPTAPIVGGGGNVGGVPSTPGTPPPSGGGGGGGGGVIPVQGAKVLSLTSATISGNVITITPNAATFRQPIIAVDQNAAMNLKVNRSGKIYDLGTWDLTASTNNDIFSITNAPKLNVLETLNLIKATGVQSSVIFSAIDFHAVLKATQGMTEPNKNKVYNSLANIFNEASNTSATNQFYQALNLPSIYNAADANAKISIETIVNAAIPAGVAVTANELLGVGSSAQAVALLNQSNKMNEFFSGINFQSLYGALFISPNKEAIFTAINFTELYNAIETLPETNKMAVYLNAALIYQAALSVDVGITAINYGDLLQMVMPGPGSSQNTFYMYLTKPDGTRTTYTVVKG